MVPPSASLEVKRESGESPELSRSGKQERTPMLALALKGAGKPGK